jgi:hypothetical protein
MECQSITIASFEVQQNLSQDNLQFAHPVVYVIEMKSKTVNKQKYECF